MKKITLENGKVVNISEESYNELVNAVKEPSFKDVVEERMLSKDAGFYAMFSEWGTCGEFVWLNNSKMQKDWVIFLHMMLWKDTYDKYFEPDWENSKQFKYSVDCTELSQNWDFDMVLTFKKPMTVYLSSKEKVLQMIKDLKEIGVIK
jgi:hypothetical protein